MSGKRRHLNPGAIFSGRRNSPWWDSQDRIRVYGRWLGRANALFVDGHAEQLRPNQWGFQYPPNHANAGQKVPAGDPVAIWDKQ